MQQTILALGALMIIMLTAISHQRSAIMIQEMSYVRELENAALSAAKTRADSIFISTAFDERWVGREHIPDRPDRLTPSNQFGIDSGDTFRDDLDDYNNLTVSYSHVIAQDTFRFIMNHSVTYIDDDGDPSNQFSFTKQIITEAVSVDTIGVRVPRASYQKTILISETLGN